MTSSVQRMIEKEASQPGRLLWMIDSLWLCGGNGEDLADLDLVGVMDDGAVGLVEFRPAGAGAIELLGDAPQAVAGSNGVSVLRGRLRRRFLRRRFFRGFGGRFLGGKTVILGEVCLQSIQLGLGQTGAADIVSGCGS